MPYIDPDRAQFEAFKNLPRDEPLNMLNLVKFKSEATYEDGRSVTGAEAYANYSRESGSIFARVGGKILWRGEPKAMLIGPDRSSGTEAWDTAFVAYYPTAGAFLEMVTDPAYQIAVKHRQAAVADSRLLRCGELEGGDGFG